MIKRVRGGSFAWVTLAAFALVAAVLGGGPSWAQSGSDDGTTPSPTDPAPPDRAPASPINMNGAFELGARDVPLPAGTATIVGTPLPYPAWAELFNASRTWKDVIDEFGNPGSNGVPDFLDTWGDNRARRDARFITDDISAGRRLDATALIGDSEHVGPGIVDPRHDLGNLYAYLTYDAQGNQILYAGVERLASAGPSSIDLEFNQNVFSVGGEGSIQGQRTVGDVRAHVEVDAQGLISGVEFRSYDLDPEDGTYKYMARVALDAEGCNAAGSACVVTNAIGIAGGGWPSFDASGNSVSNLSQKTTLELGLNVSAVLGVPEVRFTGIQATTPQDYASGTFPLILAAVNGGCVSEVSGFNANCNANDVRLTAFVEGSVDVLDDGCQSTSDTITFTARGVFDCGSQERYDVGVFISTDGDPNGDFARSGLCTRDMIGHAPDPPYVDIDGDVCGDIDASHSPLAQSAGLPLGPFTIKCVDTNHDGLVDVSHCETWNQPGANTVCNSPADIKAGAPSKCHCDIFTGTIAPCIAASDGNDCTRDVCVGTCASHPDTTCENSSDCPADDYCHALTPEHILQAAGSACGDQSDTVCHSPDACDANGTCVANFQPATTVCRPSTGFCDATETCTGISNDCPVDGFASSATSCTGVSQNGACDGADHCSGSDDTCVDVFLPSSTTCRASAGPCDVAESCGGSSGSCPTDGFQPATTTCTGTSNGGVCDGADSCDGAGRCVDGFRSATTICRPATGPCDVAESCTGETGFCPADGFQPATTTCTGTSNGGVCDGTDSCDGAGRCVDGFRSATTICRPATGPCDVAESCTGETGFCPADGFQPATTTCTGTSNGGPCDGTDSCDGQGRCVDGFRSATTICRPATNPCDVAESCTGQSGSCPADGFQPATTTCTGTSNGGVCDGTDSCDGQGHCVDGYQPLTTICRPATNPCDVAESCTGQSGSCPTDGFQPATTTCTGTSNGGVCDGADSCDGAGHCVDGYQPLTTICRPATNPCDVAESCTGQSGSCPTDGFQPATTTCTGTSNGGPCDGTDSCDGQGRCVDGFRSATTICRPSTGPCDVAESCSGTTGSCPADGFQPATTTCTGTSNGGPCDGTDSCDGQGRCVDGYKPLTTICRPATNPCDVAESCTGQSGSCPTDGFQPATTTCTGTSNGGPCDGTDSCDGQGHCVDGYRAATTICRPSTGPCDVAESCSGTTGSCPTDGFQPATTTCTGTSNGGACDGTDSCDGQGHCVDGFRSATTICRPSTGPCDVAESCSGTTGSCPADGFQPATTTCTGTSNGGVCDGTDSCDGQGHCVDGYRAATTICRPSTGPCDVAESCSGTAGSCPMDGFQLAAMTCTGTSNGGVCDGADTCDGAGHCVDAFRSATTICRPSTGPCDVAESCSGTSGSCPADGFQPATTTCRAATGACDVAETCSGSTGACPPDRFRPTGTVCRAGSGDVCDASEACTGSSPDCPPDQVAPSSTVCRPSSGGSCDSAEYCSGIPGKPCPPDTSTQNAGHASIGSDFNGTPIPAGRSIWFNANFKASGVGAGTTTIQWTHSTITFMVGSQIFALAVPDGQIVFDSSAACATTSFNTSLQRWETRVPVSGSDEVFLSGLALQVPYNFPGGIKPVTWTGDFTADNAGVSVSWKWGAAVYSGTSMSDYNAVGVKPMHTNTCAYSGSDHAGTPMNKKSFVVGGARGGGGSNFTGSWSGTQNLTLACQSSQSLTGVSMTDVSFADQANMVWTAASGASFYDILRGDIADLRADGGVGGAFCHQDDLAATRDLDDDVPEPDHCFYYLVRGVAVSLAPGSYGTGYGSSDGADARDDVAGAKGGADCTHR